MNARLRSDPASGATSTTHTPKQPELTRAAMIDAVARVIVRYGPTGVRWPAIAREAGASNVTLAPDWFPDLPALVDECYARAAQGLEESLLRAETTPGTAIDKLAAFLVAALEMRRERGTMLSFRRGDELSPVQRRRLCEHDMMVRTRLKRMLINGRRDGSLALRNIDSACEMVLACLQTPAVTVDGPEQRIWDGELIELLLAALAEPHPPTPARHEVRTAKGSCLCGEVRYEVDGPFDVMSHCQCSMCRQHHGTASATFVAAPLERFRWISGLEQVKTYHSSEHGTRSFCTACGSVAPTLEEETERVFCPAGNLEVEVGARQLTLHAAGLV